MGDLTHWIAGDLTPRARVLTALAPAIIVSAFFVGAYVYYNVLLLLKRMPHQFDNDVARGAGRGQVRLVGSHLRLYFFWVIEPFWKLLLKSGVSANTVTGLAAALGVGAGLAAAGGRFAVAGWLFMLSGTLDALDGRLARARNEVSPAGEAVDSILDRYIDSIMLVGLGAYYYDSWVVIPVMLALMGTAIVPYVRAKSEALGFPMRDGLMQRAERILYLGASVALSPILEAILFPHDRHPVHYLAVGGILFLCVTSNVTAVARFVGLVRSLNSGAPRKTTTARDETRAA
jgi:phosphatidylglycerophosphate synthase